MKKFEKIDNNNNDIQLSLYQSGVVVENALVREVLADVVHIVHEGGRDITHLPTQIWQRILELKILSHEDIVSLRRSNGHIRRALNKCLQMPVGDQARVYTTSRLRRGYNRWVEAFKTSQWLRQKTRVLIELLLAVFVIVLFTSLGINTFQVPYAMTYWNITMKIISQGMFCQVPYSNNWIGPIQLANLTLPSECPTYPLEKSFFGTPVRATDGPAEFWFSNFAPVLAATISARVFFGVKFKENPIIKVTAAGVFIVSGTAYMLLPFIVSRGWPIQNAISSACESAYRSAFWKGYSGCPHYFGLAAFENIYSINPLIPQLADQPYIVPAIGLVAMAGLGFFGDVAKRKIDRITEFDPNEELQEPVRLLRHEANESTRLL